MSVCTCVIFLGGRKKCEWFLSGKRKEHMCVCDPYCPLRCLMFVCCTQLPPGCSQEVMGHYQAGGETLFQKERCLYLVSDNPPTFYSHHFCWVNDQP